MPCCERTIHTLSAHALIPVGPSSHTDLPCFLSTTMAHQGLRAGSKHPALQHIKSPSHGHGLVSCCKRAFHTLSVHALIPIGPSLCTDLPCFLSITTHHQGLRAGSKHPALQHIKSASHGHGLGPCCERTVWLSCCEPVVHSKPKFQTYTVR